MSIANKEIFSEVIDVTLYKYNSIDLKLWGLVSRYTGTKVLGEASLLVSKEDLHAIILKYFKTEVVRFSAISDVNIHKEATSVYFLNQVFESMHNLTWVKLTLNKNASYNRVVNIDQIKTIKFSIKTLRGTLRLFDIFNSHEAEVAHKLLIRAGVFKSEEHFTVIRVKKFLSIMDLFLSENNTTEVFNIVNALIQLVEAYESDDPEMLLITDKKSDI